MISFLFRIAIRSAIVQRFRFFSLALTLVVASSFLIVLSSLYLNAESQLSLELSGVPNMVVGPKKSIVAVSRLTSQDVLALKSKNHFWKNNIVNAAPMVLAEGEINGKKVKIAGTWFKKEISVDKESYTFGVLKFSGWSYQGDAPSDKTSMILGANIDLRDSATLKIRGSEKDLTVAGVLRTGSYWDNYIFIDSEVLREMISRDEVDQILVSALIMPKNKLAVKAELYGIESLSPEERTTWYCSPYASTIAYTIKEVVPHSEVKILRRITEVQEGILKASFGVFGALLVLTLIASITTVFSAEKMYVSSKMKELGVMVAMGASRQKILVQLVAEISIASLLSAVLAYMLSKGIVEFMSGSIFGIDFKADTTLIASSLVIPFLVSIGALILLKRGLDTDVVEILR